MSSMVPTIVVKAGEPVMAIGGAGGTSVPTSSALVLFHYFYRNVTFKAAIEHKRIHHQLFPPILYYEDGFDQVMAALS